MKIGFMRKSASKLWIKGGQWVIFSLCVCQLCRGIMLGFRIPTRYVMSQYMFTYKYGFIPRGLIGTLLRLFTGEAFYTYYPHIVLALLAVAVFMIWLIYNLYRSCMAKEPFLVAILIVWFSICCFAGYYTSIAGYYEQYGYIFAAILIEQIAYKKQGSTQYIVYSGIYMAVSCLISETNAFLVCPVIVFITILQIYKDFNEDKKELIKKFVYAILLYIPSGIFCIAVNFFRVSEERVLKIVADIRSHTDLFPVLEALGGVMYGPRTPEDRFTTFQWRWVNPVFWMFLTVVILTVTFYLFYYLSAKKEAVLYFVLSIVLAFLTYTIVFVAWDFDRYYCCMIVTNLILSIYTLRVFSKKERPIEDEEEAVQSDGTAEKKKRQRKRKGVKIAVMVLAICVASYVVFSMRECRVWLMDDGTYNETFEEFVYKLNHSTDYQGSFVFEW